MCENVGKYLSLTTKKKFEKNEIQQTKIDKIKHKNSEDIYVCTYIYLYLFLCTYKQKYVQYVCTRYNTTTTCGAIVKERERENYFSVVSI